MQEMQETWVQSLGWEDPLEEEMATHSNVLACKIPWTEEPGSLQSMGSQSVGHDWARACTHTHTHTAVPHFPLPLVCATTILLPASEFDCCRFLIQVESFSVWPSGRHGSLCLWPPVSSRLLNVTTVFIRPVRWPRLSWRQTECSWSLSLDLTVALPHSHPIL